MKTGVVLGIDPGYDRLGWAVGTVTNRNFTLLECGLVQTVKTDTFYDRLKEIQQAIEKVITQYEPSHMAIETLVAAKNAPTVVAVAQVRGLLIGKALEAGMQIGEYAPSQVKLAVTGYGRASKADVARMVETLTKTSMAGYKDDAIDAVAIAITGAVIG